MTKESITDSRRWNPIGFYCEKDEKPQTVSEPIKGLTAVDITLREKINHTAVYSIYFLFIL
jgi:hypothetical protein